MPDLAASPWSDLVAIGRDLVLPIATIVIVAFLALRFAELFVRGLVRTVLDREALEGTAQDLSAVEIQKRLDTLGDLGARIVRSFIVIIGGLMVLGEFGLDIGPAVAGLGVVGIAIGFGAQSLVHDYFNGALILLENQFSKGDIVRLADVAGTVEDFTLRRTTLRDLDGVVHTIPNGEIRVASNMTRVWARINENVQVAYGTDISQAMEVIARVGREMADDPAWGRRILEPPKVERVQSLDDSGVSLKILGSVRAGDQWAAAGDLRRRLLVAFARDGIEIPFPHRVIMRPGGDTGETGDAAPPAGQPGPAPRSRRPRAGSTSGSSDARTADEAEAAD